MRRGTLELSPRVAGAHFEVSSTRRVIVGRDTSAEWDGRTIGPIEYELTIHLERAHELSERAKESNGIVQREISRARDIARALREEFGEPRDSVADRLR